MTRNPQTPLNLDIADCPQAIEVLERVRTGLEQGIAGQSTEPLSLQSLSDDARALVLEALGEGEIRAELDAHNGHPQAILYETQLTGVWRWQLLDHAAQVLEDSLEAGDCPQLMRQRPFHAARACIGRPQDFADNLMDGVAVLAELEAHLEQHFDAEPEGQRETTVRNTSATSPAAPYRLNLSMMPQSPAALELIDQRLGRGPARMTNSGYGSCQIEATSVRCIWRLKHFDDSGRLLLDSLEICLVPTAVLATAEDLADSHARLGELLATIDSGAC